jgi:hypothetical protein
MQRNILLYTKEIIVFINRNLKAIDAQDTQIYNQLNTYWKELNNKILLPLDPKQRSYILYATLLVGMNLIAASGCQTECFEYNSHIQQQLTQQVEQYQSLLKKDLAPNKAIKEAENFEVRIIELGNIIDYNKMLDDIEIDHKILTEKLATAIASGANETEQALVALKTPLESLCNRLENIKKYDKHHECLAGELKCLLADIHYRLYTIRFSTDPSLCHLPLVQTSFHYIEAARALFKKHPALHSTLTYFARHLDQYQRILFNVIKTALEKQTIDLLRKACYARDQDKILDEQRSLLKVNVPPSPCLTRRASKRRDCAADLMIAARENAAPSLHIPYLIEKEREVVHILLNFSTIHATSSAQSSCQVELPGPAGISFRSA